MKEQLDDNWSTAKAVFKSWQSMNTLVMIWLFYLNVLYWLALLFWQYEESRWVLYSLLAVVPIVLTMATQQRGLTRLSGLIHLPWVPLLIYLLLRLETDILAPQIRYETDPKFFIWLELVFWSTLLCVTLDIWDVWRWYRGERFVLGSEKAANLGASKLA